MALVEGAIRRCSLRLIKSKTLLPWYPLEPVEGEDETNISGLCLPAAFQCPSVQPIAMFIYSSIAVHVPLKCVCNAVAVILE